METYSDSKMSLELAWSSSRNFLVSLKENTPKLASLEPVQQTISNHVPHIAIEFAPAKIPRKRRLQTAAVAMWALTMPMCLALFFFLWFVPFCFVGTSLSVRSSFPLLWPFILSYMVWVHIDPAPESGGRCKQWVRELGFWRHFAAYYPVS